MDSKEEKHVICIGAGNGQSMAIMAKLLEQGDFVIDRPKLKENRASRRQRERAKKTK